MLRLPSKKRFFTQLAPFVSKQILPKVPICWGWNVVYVWGEILASNCFGPKSTCWSNLWICIVHFRNTLIIIFCDRVWRRDRVDVMRMSQLVDKCGLIHKGHMNLSFISRQFVKSNRTHSSNIAFCLSEKPAIFNDMSSTPTKRWIFTFPYHMFIKE